MNKFKMIQVSKTTFAMVKDGRIAFFIKDGKILRDPLMIRHHQWKIR